MEKTSQRACLSPAINTCSAWFLLDTRTYLWFLIFTTAQLCKDMAERTNTFKGSVAIMTKNPSFSGASPKNPSFSRASPINMHCPGIQFGLGDPLCPQKCILNDKLYGPLINNHDSTAFFFLSLETLRGGSGNTNDRQNCARNKGKITGGWVEHFLLPLN